MLHGGFDMKVADVVLLRVWFMVAAIGLHPALARASSQTGVQKAPLRFEVRGLADWDRLKMRLGPGANSPAVGEIPARAQGVIATGRQRHVGGAIWREVEFQGVRGWVLGRFIRREASAAAASRGDTSDVFAEDLVCVGHAPAWKLVVDRDGSTAGSTAFGRGLTDVHALAAQPQRGAGRSWSMTLEDAEGVGVATLSLRQAHCTAGNAADVYGYEVTTHQPNGIVLTGCCNLRGHVPLAEQSAHR
jgi:uncharacterized membrane protein